jgi:hypothetical protein
VVGIFALFDKAEGCAKGKAPDDVEGEVICCEANMSMLNWVVES